MFIHVESGQRVYFLVDMDRTPQVNAISLCLRGNLVVAIQVLACIVFLQMYVCIRRTTVMICSLIYF